VLDIPCLLSIHNVLNVPPRKKSSGERSGLRGGQGTGPSLPIQASGNLSFKTSVTNQLKWGGAPSCIKINLLAISCSKVSICGNTYFLSYSGFKSRPCFSMTLYLLINGIIFLKSHKMCVTIFSTNLPETFLIFKRNERDMIRDFR